MGVRVVNTCSSVSLSVWEGDLSIRSLLKCSLKFLRERIRQKMQCPEDDWSGKQRTVSSMWFLESEAERWYKSYQYLLVDTVGLCKGAA